MVALHSPHQEPSWNQAQVLLDALSSLSYRDRDLDSYLYNITCAVSSILGVDWSVVTCCGRENYEVVASNIKLELTKEENSFNLHGSLTGRVVETGEILNVRDTKENNQYGVTPEGYRSYLGVPLKTPAGKTIGTVCCFGVEPKDHSPESLRIARMFAERAAIAIDNYDLYQKQQDFNRALEIEVTKRTAELKAAQAQLIEKEKLAAIGQFASMIVHEIRNPSTTILMGLTSLQRLELDERNQMRLSLALDEAERLQNLLEEILLYAKPQLLNSEEIELNQFLSELTFALEEMPQAKERHFKLICNDSETIVKGDRDKLKQVVINLVKNAFEEIEPGETVTCKLSIAKDPNYYCINFNNGGTPIPPELIPKLTEPFISKKSGGTGLGLAIVKQIVTTHGGTLTITSDAASGTNIGFTLPKYG